MRRIIFNWIMETSISKIRPASPPHVALQPLDKRPRLASPAPTLQAEVKSIAPKRSQRKKHAPPAFGSSEDVISREVVRLLGNEVVARAEADGVEWESPFGFREEVELTVSSISPSGMSHFKVYPDGVSSTPFSILPRSLTKTCLNRGRAGSCTFIRPSMGCRRAVRVAWRGCPRPRVQACKDVLLCRPDQCRSSQLGNAQHESCSVQVLWNMRWVPVPGTSLPSVTAGLIIVLNAYA